jgi:hypothetical protein
MALSTNAPRLRPDQAALLDRRAVDSLPLGTHLVTPRRGYLHHGIYAGGGKIVHYAGLRRSMWLGPVEEVSLAQFARGRAVAVATDPSPLFTGPEIVRRARSRLGENRYGLITNNCEHLCAWCLAGMSCSAQVDRCRSALHRLTDRLVKPFSKVGRSIGRLLRVALDTRRS